MRRTPFDPANASGKFWTEQSRVGKRIRQWGGPGADLGEFHVPHAIQVDPKGIIYVANRENGCIEGLICMGSFWGRSTISGDVIR